MNYTYFPSDLTTGLKELTPDNPALLRTFATVISVSSEGLFVDVVLDMYDLGNTSLSHIPVLKDNYLNLPIRPGDKVFLTTTSHLLNSYFESGSFIEKTMCENYVAIPVITEPIMQSKQFTNDFTYVNPEMTYRELINASKNEVTGETIDQMVKLQSSMQEYSQDYSIKCNNYTLEAQSNIECKAQSNITMEAQSNIECKAQSNITMEAQSNIDMKGNSAINASSPNISIEANGSMKLNSPRIDLGSAGIKLGSLLGQLCDALASSTTTTVGGPSTQTGPTLSTGGTVSSIGAQIRSVFS